MYEYDQKCKCSEELELGNRNRNISDFMTMDEDCSVGEEMFDLC